MAEFITTVTNQHAREHLAEAIAGKRPFRRFKDALYDYPQERERWFAFSAEGSHCYLLDLYRARADFPTLRRQVLTLAEKWRADKVVIEETAAGNPILQEFRRSGLGGRLITVKPSGNKVARVAAITHLFEQGFVHLPRSAAWIESLRDELLAFPHGSYDDQVDSVSQFLGWRTSGNSVVLKRLQGL